MTAEAVFLGGFPDELKATVRRVSQLLDEPSHPSRSGDEVALASKVIRLPGRVYVAEPPPELLESLETAELVVARCLLARHQDGFVRQRQIEDLVRLSESWSVPYVLALLGEYVLEIHQALAETLVPALENDQLIRDLHGEFVSTNLEWWGLIQNRVVSYWSTYHRFKYPMERTEAGRRIPDVYPAARVVRSLGHVGDVPRLIKPLR